MPASADTNELVAEIKSSCRSVVSGQPTIAAADLKKVFEKQFPINYVWKAASPPPTDESILNAIVEAGLRPGGQATAPNGESYAQIGMLVLDWMGLRTNRVLPIEQGGLAITDKSGRTLSSDDLKPVLTAIYLGRNSDRYAFACTKGTEPEQEPPEGTIEIPRPSITIAKAPSQLGKGGADDQEAGEIGVIDDRVKDSTSFATNIAVGLAIPIFRHKKLDEFRPFQVAQANIIPFIAYNRQGARDPSDDSYVNNLSFGLTHNGYFVWRGGEPGRSKTFSAYYALTGKYETDDGFRSDAFLAEALLQPLLPLPGNTTPYYLVKDTPLEFGFMWTLAGVADYSHVSDPWKKQSLLDTKEYTRLGTNVAGALILRPGWNQGDWTIKLEAGRSDRFALTSQGKAHLFTSKLSFSPADNYSISLGYQDGQELDSLAKIKQWKMTIDLKR